MVVGGYLCQQGCVVVVGHSVDDGAGPLLRIAGLEDTGAYEDSLCAELHHQGGVSRGCHSAGCEVYHWQLAVLVYVLDQVVGYFQLLGLVVQLVLGQGLETADVTHHAAHVGHGLYHVTGAGLALGADHRGSLGDTALIIP